MLNIKFSLQIKTKIKAKCPKHPRYNPEMGQGPIKGHCTTCHALYEVTKARDELRAAAAKFEEAAKPYQVLRVPLAERAQAKEPTVPASHFPAPQTVNPVGSGARQ